MKFPRLYLPAIKSLILVIFIAFTCLPLVQMTLISFIATLPTPDTEVGTLTLSNYAGIWIDPNLRSAVLNSIAYVLINILITIPTAIPAAYAFSRMSFLGDKYLFLAFIAFRITPPVVLTLPIFQLFSNLGIVNSVFGLRSSGLGWRIACLICRSRSGFYRASSLPYPGRWMKPHFSTAIRAHSLYGISSCPRLLRASQLEVFADFRTSC